MWTTWLKQCRDRSCDSPAKELFLKAVMWDVCVLSHFSHVQLCSPPGSSVHGVLQARVLEASCHFLLQGVFPTQGWKPTSPALAGRFFTTSATWEASRWNDLGLNSKLTIYCLSGLGQVFLPHLKNTVFTSLGFSWGLSKSIPMICLK